MPVTAPAPPPFSLLFRDHAPAVAGLLATLVPREQVEELVQETFVAALRAYDRFDGRSPRAWVLAIARRKAIDEHRARGRRLPQTELEAERLAASPRPGPRPGGIWDDVAALPPKQRAALVLRYAFDMPHREIGEVLGCSEAAARRSVHEGLAKLREANRAVAPTVEGASR